jgi:hypothetical protein
MLIMHGLWWKARLRSHKSQKLSQLVPYMPGLLDVFALAYGTQKAESFC